MNASLAALPHALPSVLADRAALSRAVDLAANVTEKRNTFPILGNLRLTGDGNTLFVVGSDTDIEVVVAAPAAADSAFDLTLPAHLLKSLLKGAPKADHVAMTMPGVEKVAGTPHRAEHLAFVSDAAVEFERVNYNVPAIHPEDWPVMKAPVTESAAQFSISGADFLAGLDAAAFAISKEETRYYLNGIYLHEVNGELRFVATDGHRMARQGFTTPAGAEGMPGGILPTKLVSLCQKLMKGKSTPETVSVTICPERVRLSFDDVTITAKLIEGTFPDYDRVTPRNNDKPFTINIAEAIEAVNAVSLVASDRGGRAVKLSIYGSQLSLSCQSPDNGSAVTTIAAETDVAFDGFEIGFNARYFIDMLKNMSGGGDTATLTVADGSSPALFANERAGWVGVCMPMRV